MVKVIAVGKCIKGKIVFTKCCVAEVQRGKTKTTTRGAETTCVTQKCWRC